MTAGFKDVDAVTRERCLWADACCDRLRGKALALWKFHATGYGLHYSVPAAWRPHLVLVDAAFLNFYSDRDMAVSVSARVSWAEPWCRISEAYQEIFSGCECWTGRLVHRSEREPTIRFFVLDYLRPGRTSG